jgi:hypothetical protein
MQLEGDFGLAHIPELSADSRSHARLHRRPAGQGAQSRQHAETATPTRVALSTRAGPLRGRRRHQGPGTKGQILGKAVWGPPAKSRGAPVSGAIGPERCCPGKGRDELDLQTRSREALAGPGDAASPRGRPQDGGGARGRPSHRACASRPRPKSGSRVTPEVTVRAAGGRRRSSFGAGGSASAAVEPPVSGGAARGEGRGPPLCG